MIPSLVVGDLRKALVEYLATTFALSDDDVRDALSAFLEDSGDGIFRGPYLRVRTPFRSVPEGWTWPLDWHPDDFVPHAHQGQAFDRLTTVGGHAPEPTIVTTGTGSGKTECFLYPILDHCARARSAGQPGIKALLLYPMNALATDQAGRIADLIHSEVDLAGLTAGVYVGDAGRHAAMGPDHLIDQREVLRADPPDILLTNYKMLDFLLLRREDRDLWAVNQADTLRYVVLDELHTYDGAQGTDVAMLLRRLGRTLKMSATGRPLGDAAPVATSATLGSGPVASTQLRAFAHKVFGVEFDAAAIITEQRRTVEEACAAVDYFLPIPDPGEVVALGVDDADAVATAFCWYEEQRGVDLSDLVDLGSQLLAHPLTRAVLSAVDNRARSWTEAVAEIITRAPSWGTAFQRDPRQVELALGRYLWLLSIAKRQQGTRLVPLFSIDVQIWVREISRLLREVSTTPTFRWRDAAAVHPNGEPQTVVPELPAVYCRRCGMSGWMALQADNSVRLSVGSSAIYTAALQRSAKVRVLLRCAPLDPMVRWYDPVARMLLTEEIDGAAAVLVTATEEDALRNRCPACTEADSIRFVGLRTASLASVSINTLFGSPHVELEERKLLVFTDSVQDASHRAAFFAGRTHRINLRTLMAGIVGEEGSVPLSDLGDLLAASAGTDRERFGLVPPDLLRHPLVRTTWTADPKPAGLELLRARMGFEVDLEFGLRSRVGRTLELSRAVVAAVTFPDEDVLFDLVVEDLVHQLGEVSDETAAGVPAYVRGLVERLRMRGGIRHPLLKPYVEDSGRIWHVWGGRPDGLPPFTPGQGRPLFFSTAPKGDFDSLVAASKTPTWLVDWAVRALAIDPAVAPEVNRRTLALLATQSEVVEEIAAGGSRVYALSRHHIVVHDVVDDDPADPEPAAVRCNLCGSRHPAPPVLLDAWIGSPCLRYRCPGSFVVELPRVDNYYRKLYRSGVTTRVVTGEHTGLLQRADREDLERAFKSGTAPDAPNVIAATPTLEMGIDIGDLSAVMLAGVPRSPASYIQRVGRAGRATGNSLITTFVSTDTHGLYYLADPEAMISGEVRPPDCYLDAVDTLRRQYIAYLIDRLADLSLDGPTLPYQIGAAMKSALDEGGLFRLLIDASSLEPEWVEGFLDLFAGQLVGETVNHLREFASGGLEIALKSAHAVWNERLDDLSNRRKRLTTAIEKLNAKEHRSGDEEDELRSLRGQRQAAINHLREHRGAYTLSALEALGVLPNYTLIDDGVTLEATMWSRTEDDQYETTMIEYTRSASLAVRELAPGNSFYAGGHRHVVDALAIGTATEPHYEPWRLCPDCGYGRVEAAGDSPPPTCPRCKGAGIADMGARHLMLRLRTSFSSSSEEDARVYDDDDDRRQEHYDILTTVDAEPEHINGAWHLVDKAFGAELSSRTLIRTINLGFQERKGDTLAIAGDPRHLTRFRVCRQCGAAADARDDRDGTRPERLHQGWCKARTKAQADWDDILLYHQLTTEAIRMLLPVSLFEVDERLVSFTGALLLGLREDFGGEADHLSVVRSEAPNRGGQGRRRFLVLYDAVPGGTGYLAPLAQPDRVRSVLEAARDLISKCPCQGEGRAACHRCLLGVIDRRDYDLARRDLALELLDDLLESWTTETVDTVAGLDMGKVEESELERRFKIALRDWVTKIAADPDYDGPAIALQSVPGVGKYDAFELRFGTGADTIRYRIEEQAGVSTTPSTIPDFLIRRMDTTAPEIAVYLDGFQFHASAEYNNLAGDARKRAGLRQSGRFVWSLTWDDVDRFHRSALSESSAGPPPRRLLSGAGQQTALAVHHARGGALDYRLIDRNPMELLFLVLAHPVIEDWEAVSLSAVAGASSMGQTRGPFDADGVADLLLQAVEGTAPAGTAAGDAAGLVSTFTSESGHQLHCFLRFPANVERWTVISSLPDSDVDVDDASHRVRWHDWLQWSNVLQFVRGTGRDGVTCTTSMGSDALDDLWIVDGAPSEPSSASVVLSPDMASELELLEDDDVRALVEAVLHLGAPDFEAGYELPSGEPVEAAWPSERVAIAAPGAAAPTESGWTIRSAVGWTAQTLLDELRK